MLIVCDEKRHPNWIIKKNEANLNAKPLIKPITPIQLYPTTFKVLCGKLYIWLYWVFGVIDIDINCCCLMHCISQSPSTDSVWCKIVQCNNKWNFDLKDSKPKAIALNTLSPKRSNISQFIRFLRIVIAASDPCKNWYDLIRHKTQFIVESMRVHLKDKYRLSDI